MNQIPILNGENNNELLQNKHSDNKPEQHDNNLSDVRLNPGQVKEFLQDTQIMTEQSNFEEILENQEKLDKAMMKQNYLDDNNLFDAQQYFSTGGKGVLQNRQNVEQIKMNLENQLNNMLNEIKDEQKQVKQEKKQHQRAKSYNLNLDSIKKQQQQQYQQQQQQYQQFQQQQHFQEEKYEEYSQENSPTFYKGQDQNLQYVSPQPQETSQNTQKKAKEMKLNNLLLLQQQKQIGNNSNNNSNREQTYQISLDSSMPNSGKGTDPFFFSFKQNIGESQNLNGKISKQQSKETYDGTTTDRKRVLEIKIDEEDDTTNNTNMVEYTSQGGQESISEKIQKQVTQQKNLLNQVQQSSKKQAQEQIENEKDLKIEPDHIIEQPQTVQKSNRSTQQKKNGADYLKKKKSHTHYDAGALLNKSKNATYYDNNYNKISFSKSRQRTKNQSYTQNISNFSSNNQSHLSNNTSNTSQVVINPNLKKSKEGAQKIDNKNYHKHMLQDLHLTNHIDQTGYFSNNVNQSSQNQTSNSNKNVNVSNYSSINHNNNNQNVSQLSNVSSTKNIFSPKQEKMSVQYSYNANNVIQDSKDMEVFKKKLYGDGNSTRNKHKNSSFYNSNNPSNMTPSNQSTSSQTSRSFRFYNNNNNKENSFVNNSNSIINNQSHCQNQNVSGSFLKKSSGSQAHSRSNSNILNLNLGEVLKVNNNSNNNNSAKISNVMSPGSCSIKSKIMKNQLNSKKPYAGNKDLSQIKRLDGMVGSKYQKSLHHLMKLNMKFGNSNNNNNNTSNIQNYINQ